MINAFRNHKTTTMNKTSFYIFSTVIAGLISCNHANEQKLNAEPPAVKADTSMELKPANRYESVIFASKRDTICGMPLTAGVEDTLHVDGKVYGFCATECKEEFVKQLTAKKSK